jgi:hypothetical protein
MSGSKEKRTKPDDPRIGNLVNGGGLKPGPLWPSLLVRRPKTETLPTCSVNLMRVAWTREEAAQGGAQGQLRTALATAQGCLLIGLG